MKIRGQRERDLVAVFLFLSLKEIHSRFFRANRSTKTAGFHVNSFELEALVRAKRNFAPRETFLRPVEETKSRKRNFITHAIYT